MGYGMAPKQLIQAMHRVREPFNVNSLAQVAAIAALDDQEHLEATRRLLCAEKPFLYQSLKELGLSCLPSAANFILFRLGPNVPEVVRALLKKGIIVRDMTVWKLPEYVRVTIGLHEENQAFIQALKEELKGRISS